ncbi:hypothetical protein, partial [Burkholderia aenigmatica]|uniref:hypothetical protein n=1 Tax=Burkholderia aenigmatica TaxID=2015348 RepID=UPI00264D5E48
SVQLRTGRSLKADRNMNCFINLTYFSVRLLILSLSDPRISSLSSSAHTYRLLIFKEHFCEELRVSQQRCVFSSREARVSTVFSNSSTTFLTTSLRRLRFNSKCAGVVKTDINSTASLLSPRCVSVSAKEA